MNDTVETHPTVRDLTLEEKASLTSGGDAWHLQGVESKGIPGYMITDGPHGLRKSLAASTGETDLNASVPATCFPPAAGLSSSWNPALIREVGEAMAEECIQEKVAVILGPGVNIKRNPLGGRCFEYWSEDPYLAGHEAVGIVEGVQSKGVGTSLKHFAANNQETDRLRVDARISQRALREIYLPAFEHIVKTAQPWTIMCSYNRINGVHSAQNHWLLTDVLRGEWGFEGIVMSDWGADHDRVASLNAGLNLEMPPSGTDDQIVHAVRDGRIEPAQLDRMAQGMIDLVDKTRAAMNVDGYRFDAARHHDVARRAAAESIVMLKNDDATLPLDAHAIAAGERRLAVIGEFARTPRYQGGGSSHITPTTMTSFLDALDERGVAATFAPGFTLDLEPADPALESQAVDAARAADTVLMFLGLPEAAESEGFDREHLDLPAKQTALLRRVAEANPNVIVVLSNGSVVSVAPWAADAKAILESWLLGQAGGAALADIVFGDVSPSGKLAQTIPLNIADDPSMINWPGEEGHVDYGEGVFVGYRYYDTYGRPVDYPFGYGLSYATFAIGDVTVDRTGANTARVSVTVTNTSDVTAAETVQVYVAPGASDVARPRHELKGFAKVRLAGGESARVAIDLDERAFAYWSERFDDWHVEAGDYAIEVGTSSRDIAATASVTLDGDGKSLPLTEWSAYGEWAADPVGSSIVEAVAEAGERGDLPKLPDNAMMRMFLKTMPINSMPMLLGEAGKAVTEFMLREYAARVR
ncbi:glycoside hydrolase family 3 C-terminal domain-containing protein [Bifidobacterium amazonense]|uniref:Glycoside hydrolase family 3 C-terminal domain-containing protein n=1 Tax=Bifidobacterium amazonense TaxID=2809027 RepID=A0ABS9VVX1_9BIFI|nr:exo-alpha-(1->6)-L-arabinopyranosidase [Bifidobacterium amazonense]MCH9276250.1 glycoside hydrolase family 3 C-terminal domain-containing protein [Bifidobacterium amazonense]